MTRRTIITVARAGLDEAEVRLFKAPTVIAGARDPVPFRCDPADMPPWTDQDAVLQHGHEIRDRLKNHPAICQALDDALRIPPDEVRAIYFHLMVEEAEPLCWETLCDDKGRFLAFDRRWPIARMADSSIDAPSEVFDFTPPLRVVAFLSALGIDAEPEWESLRDAVLAARERNLEVELEIFVGDKVLLDSIQEEINGGLAGVMAQPVPTSTASLEGVLAGKQAHLLHFFCHGSTSHGVSRLEIATLLDFERRSDTSSLKLELEELVQILADTDPWVVSLNCCESGRAGEQIYSMAHTLVSHGLPAAVGMLEPFDANDAHLFCSKLYGALFDKLSRVLAAPSSEATEIEWAETLRLPRRELSDRYEDPKTHRQWAMPVLYVRPEPFRVFRRDDGTSREQLVRQQEYIGEVLRFLQALPAETPGAVREELLAIAAPRGGASGFDTEER